MRGYNRRTGAFKALPVARSVYQGGWGAWEMSARWSEIDLNDKSVDGGRTGIASLGLTWWLSPTFSFSLNYRHIRLDRGGLVGHSDGLNARIFLSLE
jgi:phosphate-selective porin OprO/OprP